MATSIDVAQYIYNKMGWIDAWKLAKLTYYSQAWSLGWYGRSMIAEEFQAWKDGPVEPNLHSENKYHRRHYYSSELPSAEVENLTDADRAVIESVLEFYGTLTKGELIDKTHSEEPWLEAREGIADEAPSQKPLSQSTMKSFYALQEIRGEATPTRPQFDYQPTPGEVRDKLIGSAQRWRTAMDLLATR